MPKIPNMAQHYDVDAIIAAWDHRFNIPVNKNERVIRSLVEEDGRHFELQVMFYGLHPRLTIKSHYAPMKTHGPDVGIECYVHMDELVINPFAHGAPLTYHEIRVLAAVCIDLSPAFADVAAIIITRFREWPEVKLYFNAPFNEIERTSAHEQWVDQAVLYCNSGKNRLAHDLMFGIESICKQIDEEYGEVSRSDALAIRQAFVNTTVDRIMRHLLDGYGLKLEKPTYLLQMFALIRLGRVADAHLKKHGGDVRGLVNVLIDDIVALWAELKQAR